MPRDVAEGSSQATYILQHSAVTRPMAVTMGHSLIDWSGTFTQAANYLFDAFADNVLNGMDTGVTFTGVNLYIGNGTAPSGSVESTRTPEPGLASGNYPPPNTALLVRKNTASLGRGATGRLFLPFMCPEANMDEGGNVDGTIVTAVQAQMNAWLAALATEDTGGNGTAPAVLNPTSSNPAVAGTPIIITGLAVQGKVATQRRRLRR